MEYRLLMKLYKNKTISDKPKKYNLCTTCIAYLAMERSLNYHRYKIADGWKTDSHSNCIVPCGYGMFAPRFYKENVIDIRRK